jgi:hypothetical protein
MKRGGFVFDGLYVQGRWLVLRLPYWLLKPGIFVVITVFFR